MAPQSGIRGIASDLPRYTTAEESHHEQQPLWANPQYMQANRPAIMANLTSFSTPAAQKRVIDINAPNGSASTIADNASAANSSTANTPYGIEQYHRQQGAQPGSVDFDALDRKSGFRSQSSSPLDVRKGPSGNPNHLFETRHEFPTRNTGYSPPRFGLFGTSKRDSSPPLPPPNKSLGGIHASGLMTGSGPSRMIAR